MLSYRDGQLYLEGKSVKSLADELGTPFFLISDARLRSNYNALTQPRADSCNLSAVESIPAIPILSALRRSPGLFPDALQGNYRGGR